MSITRNQNLGSSQVRARRRRLFLIRLSIIVFLILVLIFSLAILSGHEKVKIKTITITGNALVSNNEIFAIINRDIAGRYFYLFSKSNSLIFPRFKINEDILKEITAVKDLDIKWDSWQTILVSIEERKPHSVWCGEDIKAPLVDCYFVDNGGYIYGQAPVFSGNIFIKDFGTTTPLLNNVSMDKYIGNYFLPREEYIQVYSLIQRLDQNGIKAVSLFFDGFDFRLILEAGPEVIFNNKNNLEVSFQNFFTAIQTGDLNLGRDVLDINYIDLRFDNKIVIGKKSIR